jgi:hypothetical protein
VKRFGSAVLAAILGLGAHGVGASPPPAPTLSVVALYNTGLGANGAEIISVRDIDGIAALTNIAGNVDVLDLSDPTAPALIRRVTVDTTAGAPNSVAVHPYHDYFLVVTGRAGEVGAVAAYRWSDGAQLATASVGIQPDSIAIAPNGRYAVVANEAEATGVGQNGGNGSLSVVDLGGLSGGGSGTLTVTAIALPTLTGIDGLSIGRTDDIGRIAIDNSPATIEPESVAFTQDSRFAFVTLQENNGVVRLDLLTGQFTVVGLGKVLHLADTVVDNAYNPATTLNTFREPDGIAIDQTGRIFVTADEGDTRERPRGGRTVSVFDAATGVLLGDTGSQLDDAVNTAGLYADARSDRGGSEPEGLDLTEHRGRTLVAVGLERAIDAGAASGAVALVDISAPGDPTVIDLIKVGANPEGIKFLKRGSRLFVVSANEADGTVSILEVVD